MGSASSQVCEHRAARSSSKLVSVCKGSRRLCWHCQARVFSIMPPWQGETKLRSMHRLSTWQARKAEMMQAEEPEKPDSSKPVDACGEKAVQLMQKASQTWQNQPSEFREAYVDSLEQEMQEADGAENSAKLRMVLRRAVAALSPPRRLGDGCEGKLLASHASNDQATLATNLQSRLRKIVLRCLDRVDMADLRLAPVLQCLQSLLQRFQELVTGESRIACKKQWARLQAKCASTVRRWPPTCNLDFAKSCSAAWIEWTWQICVLHRCCNACSHCSKGFRSLSPVKAGSLARSNGLGFKPSVRAPCRPQQQQACQRVQREPKIVLALPSPSLQHHAPMAR
ncbi:unnamed protein product [Effrenium voratum]|nr:unnamed protein product [Effrenium voratum]